MRVLVRVDFNVPLDMESGAILDDSRIQAALPTIKYLVDHKAKVILGSHLGRPNGKVVEGLRMTPVAKRLSQIMGMVVLAATDCIGTEVEELANNLNNGGVLLLENLRFHAEEEENDTDFARGLAKLGDIYVDDAFGTAHRSHASTVGVANYLPAVSGFLMEKEMESLNKILAAPERPFAALLGGAKVSDKIRLIENILDKVDMLIIGGGMAATFLKVRGCGVGRSELVTNGQDLAAELVKSADHNKVELILPVDVVVTDSISAHAKGETVLVDLIPQDKLIADIGPKTVELFSGWLKKCRMIFWNGPMGVFEISQFANGTKSLVKLLANTGAITVVGGGSTAEIVKEMKMTRKMTHVSTGGGASLNFLEGKRLPGIDILQDK
jgi:phosphoglycerate kinase